MAEFIQTQEFGFAGEEGEKRVWEAVKEAFSGREALAFWRYPVIQESLREPDILILDAEYGVVIIEVKSLPITQIKRLSGYSWELNKAYFGKNSINPYEQAKAQLQAVLKQTRKRPALSRVPGRVLVAVPLISRDEWEEGNLDSLVSDTPMLFGDQLSKAKLLRAIERAALVAQGDLLDDRQWQQLQLAFSTSGHIKKTTAEEEAAAEKDIEAIREPQAEPKSSTNVLSGVLQKILGAKPAVAPPPPRRTRGELVRLSSHAPSPADLQQDRIAKTIPPGPQRIRGLAGSGKTVLLAQKAAVMHLKHPEWDIALVFFSRALYDQIIRWTDHWLRVLSNGDTTLADARHKLRVLHAWGAKEQPGFYRLLAENVGVEPLSVGRIPKKFEYGRGLMYAAKKLLVQAEEKQLNLEYFDAVLVDEGQDLVDEEEALQFEERQAFYWLAYKALRPVHQEGALLEEVSQKPPLRRLIWAYDEAQSLDSLIIPDTKTVFGQSWQEIFGAGAQYPGGIGKSEIMRVCYRVPGPTLVAAHALGMGLLRPAGMLSGPTRKEDWENLGYRVLEGDFRTKNPVLLTREEKNSPHLLPNLTGESLVSFSSHPSREDEVARLVEHIQRDIAEGLQPSRQILVIHLGNEGILKAIHKAFKAAGIAYFCPGKPAPNQYYGQGNRNDFWYPDAVTVTGIHQVKGNEAESVYVVGADRVAQEEDNIQLRNHLFVALSRSKGWVHLSGVDIAQTSFGKEVEEVIRQGMTIRFLPSQPKRLLDDTEILSDV